MKVDDVMNLKKKDGNANNFLVLSIITITIFFCIFSLKSKEINLLNNSISDGLVASNLAAATVDLKEYGTTNKIKNNDFNKSLKEFQRSLKENLKLDNSFKPLKSTMINGIVDIETFAIYNVDGSDIYMTKRQKNGSILNEIYPNAVGNMRTPNGVLINETTVYSKIGMEVKTFINQSQYVYKENAVDITDKP